MKKRILFIVQGEGRGHMTQALSLYQLLTEHGYEICRVLIGIGNHRELPAFFLRNIDAPVEKFLSPSFVTKNHRGVRPFQTVTKNVARLGEWRKSLDLIDTYMKQDQPDLVINFYEPMAGLYYRLRHPNVPMICIAHQYLSEHPAFRFPKGRRMDRTFLRSWTRFTASGAVRKLALSFYDFSDAPEQGVFVVPPLLRREVFSLKPEDKGYFLVYLANKGYRDDIIEWHRKYPGVQLHCFMEGNEYGEEYWFSRNLCFHRLNDKKFLDLMAGARGLVSTAGFESICEAYYLGKPALMVPVEGHYEQFCNAHDAFKAGAGIFDAQFSIERLLAFTEGRRHHSQEFRSWVDRAEEKFLQVIGEVLQLRKAA
jgi:uncharacterized protein (TIGR00661 family)